MTADFHYYETAKGHGLAHDPFKAIVGPRPIGWISSVDTAGRVNLAPYSYFNAVCDAPPMVAFGSSGWKDSIANVKATGEFVANLVTKTLAEAMNQTCAPVPHETNEFEISGLTQASCRLVKAPRVAESPAALECKLLQVVELRDTEGRPTQHWLAIGQVVGVHINKAYLKDGLFDTAAAHPILRAGYLADYAEITPAAMFRMRRPSAEEALEAAPRFRRKETV
ncbi:MAG TPA: flavin reductase family protein [Ferrovibrio sp.]|uniref:flavin reductase family protein n=1 Tax=Ferrovibrio sp. TaxID=1917215 RepID=UPI002ED05BCE